MRNDISSLAVRIMKLASDYDTYEFCDSFENEEDGVEHIKSMLNQKEQIESMIAFCDTVVANCVEVLSETSLERSVRDQFLCLHAKACTIRKELLELVGALNKSCRGMDIDKMLLTNNSRKMAGLPLWRKKNGRKRFYTRCKADEAVCAFLDYCNR